MPKNPTITVEQTPKGLDLTFWGPSIGSSDKIVSSTTVDEYMVAVEGVTSPTGLVRIELDGHDSPININVATSHTANRIS
ncbi:MAG: hypothetical protein AAF244_00325 [Pseudomonadota bacterium]